jgi:hypothetical protein
MVLTVVAVLAYAVTVYETVEYPSTVNSTASVKLQKVRVYVVGVSTETVSRIHDVESVVVATVVVLAVCGARAARELVEERGGPPRSRGAKYGAVQLAAVEATAVEAYRVMV